MVLKSWYWASRILRCSCVICRIRGCNLASESASTSALFSSLAVGMLVGRDVGGGGGGLRDLAASSHFCRVLWSTGHLASSSVAIGAIGTVERVKMGWGWSRDGMELPMRLCGRWHHACRTLRGSSKLRQARLPISENRQMQHKRPVRPRCTTLALLHPSLPFTLLSSHLPTLDEVDSNPPWAHPAKCTAPAPSPPSTLP